MPHPVNQNHSLELSNTYRVARDVSYQTIIIEEHHFHRHWPGALAGDCGS
jgi:hypothetical protein